MISGFHMDYGLGNALIMSNPFLNPETSLSHEIGLNLKFQDIAALDDELRLGWAYFNNKIDNFISMQGDAYGPDANASSLGSAFVNLIDPVRTSGHELSISYTGQHLYSRISGSIIKNNDGSGRFDRWIWRDEMIEFNPKQCGGGNQQIAALCRGDTIGDITNPMLPKETKLNLNFGIKLWHDKLDLGVILEYFGAVKYGYKFTDKDFLSFSYSVPKKTYPSRKIWHLYANYQFNKNLSFALKINNLTDLSYAYPRATNRIEINPGRSILIGAEYKF